ncbi:MAG: flagellar hook capping FlgD N-terminal domain-containing protein [Thermogemmata sp.]|nr:flagellar hook capping FlgD N-terminal domain-containing protein [Thermogemmata sp.]
MASVSSINAITQDQFLKLLIAQLQNQNPLEPLSDQEFISQLTAINTLQGVQNLNVNFGEMLRLQQLMGGTSLIGRTVTYERISGGPPASGTVNSLSVQDGQVWLHVGSDRIRLNQVLAVS